MSPNTVAIAIREAALKTAQAAESRDVKKLQQALAHETAVVQRAYRSPSTSAPIAR